MSEYIFKYISNNTDVYIAGSFNNWHKIKMNYDSNNSFFHYKIKLKDGYYEYKYIINNEWIYDNNYPVIITKDGYKNNLILIQSNKNKINRNKDYQITFFTL